MATRPRRSNGTGKHPPKPLNRRHETALCGVLSLARDLEAVVVSTSRPALHRLVATEKARAAMRRYLSLAVLGDLPDPRDVIVVHGALRRRLAEKDIRWPLVILYQTSSVVLTVGTILADPPKESDSTELIVSLLQHAVHAAGLLLVCGAPKATRSTSATRKASHG